MALQDELTKLLHSPRLNWAIQRYRDHPEKGAKARLIRQNAYARIRRLIAPDALADLTVDDFDKNILLNGGVEFEGQEHNYWDFIPDRSVEELGAMLEDGSLRTTGNCTWGYGAKTVRAAFSSAGVKDRTKVRDRLHAALRELQNDAVPIPQRLKEVRSTPGFWPNLAAGILMALQPEAWVLFNNKTTQMLEDLGLPLKIRYPPSVEDYLAYNQFTQEVRDHFGLQDLAEVDAALNEYVDAGGPSPPSYPPGTVNTWLWIIPVEGNVQDELWQFCLREGVAAMQYEVGIDPRAEYNRSLAESIAVGDNIVAYLNQNMIGGVGKVTRAFYDDATPYTRDAENPWGQRVGVDWQATDGNPIDVRLLPYAVQHRDELVLVGKTIHSIDQQAFEEIEAAIQISRENPLTGIAELLDSVPLTDIACREKGPWRERVYPVTRPFLEYVGRMIRSTMALRQNQDVAIGFRNAPAKIKQLANTRDSLSFSAFDPPFGFDAKCGWLHGFEKSFVWGAQSWGSRQQAEESKERLNRIRAEDETVICDSPANFGGFDYGVYKSLTANELRISDPVELAHRIAADLENLYRRFAKSGWSVTKPRGGTMTVIDEFIAYVNSRGFQFPRHLIASYLLALQTKPFVILTGISGTGKTKLAQLFAEWMSPPIERTGPEDDPVHLMKKQPTTVTRRAAVLQHHSALISVRPD